MVTEPAPRPLERRIRLTVPLDLRATLWPFLRGYGDPTMRLEPDGSVWRASRTTGGPAAIYIRQSRTEVVGRAWGAGASLLLEGLPAYLGLDDVPERLVPRHRVVRELQRRLAGQRFGRTGSVMEALVPAVLEQKITGHEARQSFRMLVRRYGQPAPGPGRLMLPPASDALAALPYHAFHPVGVEQRRADVIRRAAAMADRLERLPGRVAGGDGAAAYELLRSIHGIGPWTAAEVGQRAFGDPDAVSVGDYHLPGLVVGVLAGEPDGDDARMLEVLEPYAGQRGRVIRLIESAGFRGQRRAPRMAARSFAAF